MVLYRMPWFKNSKKVTSTWFYSRPHPLLRVVTVYVKGDMIVILPTLLLIALVGIFSIRFMLLLFGIFYSLRGAGEMVYWFSHQFWEKKYRPDDFGFKNLNNDAIYILYQLLSTSTTLVGLGFVAWVVIYLF